MARAPSPPALAPTDPPSSRRPCALVQPLDPDLNAKIGAIIKRRRSVDAVHSEQSQWVGPSTFSYKAEVDFDGTWLAAQLYKRYESAFLAAVESNSVIKVCLALHPFPVFAASTLVLLCGVDAAVCREGCHVCLTRAAALRTCAGCCLRLPRTSHVCWRWR